MSPSQKNQNPSGVQADVTAFLIVNGDRVIPLDQLVTNIGRKSDNQIIIDDPHVSRYHAQIQKVKGRFILVDLDSTVGTSVNGKNIKQVFLKPGDVISLGGVPIIFGQGEAESVDEAVDTLPVPAPGTGPTDANDVDINTVDDYLALFNLNQGEQE